MKVQSQFIEMFGDTHEKSDNSRQWKEVVEIINGKDYKTVQVEDGGYPVYGTGGEIARAADYLSPANSILLGRKGTIDKPLLIKEKYWNVDTAFGAVPDENILNYVYFYWHCKTIDFNILNKGTTLPSTTKVDLLNLWVKIPVMEEQNRFASIVDQADKSEFDSLRSEYELKLSFPEGDNIPQVWVSMIAGGDQNLAKQYLNDYVHKLGNLTITGYNSTLSNNSFENKRDRQDKKTHRYIGYRNGLDINKEIAQKETWTIDDITNRTDELVKELLKMYKFPE